MAEHQNMVLEDYLEAIYCIGAEAGMVRPSQVVRALGVHKSTVTAALRSLAEKGWINYRPYQSVTLTAEGKRQGSRLAARRAVIGGFLQKVLGVEPELAQANARRMMHALDEQVLERIVCFLAFAREHPERCGGWLRELECFARDEFSPECCEEWIRQYAAVDGIVTDGGPNETH
jgi:DtxR family Mn-dependent transcriptional regulator